MSDEPSNPSARPDGPHIETPVKLDDAADRAAGTRLFGVAAGAVLTSGLVLFGWDTLRIGFLCCVAAAASDCLARRIMRRRAESSRREALLLGMLMACTLPPTVGWVVPVVASAVGMLASVLLSDGQGRRLWHPVALGRVAVQIFFADQLNPAYWPVLAPNYLLLGSLAAAAPLPPLASWSSQPPGFGTQAWAMLRPADMLATTIPARAGESPAAAIAALVRDALPPWSETLTGVAGGDIGEACTLAILAAGLLLMWRGRARLATPLAGVLVGGALAAVLPVMLRADDGAILAHWLPGAARWNGLPVGLLYVLYHLTAGEFVLVLVLLAADPGSSPSTRRGRVLLGAIIGGLTITLRVFAGLPAAGYWALLIANTTVPLMNRRRSKPS